MPNPYNDGSFFWYWYEWTFPVIVAAIALSIGIAILITTDRRPYGIVVRTLAVLAVAGTIPLAEERIGIGISATENGMAVISLLGGFGAIVLAIFHFVIRGQRRSSLLPTATTSVGAATADVVLPTDVTQVPNTVPPVETATDESPGMTMVGDEPSMPPPAWLVFQSGPNAGQTIPIAGQTSIGRASGNDVVVDDEGVSRHHAEITLVGGSYQLNDVGSSGGTLVEGIAAEAAPLDSGSTVRIGGTDLVFMQGDSSATMTGSTGTEDGTTVASVDSAQTIVGQTRAQPTFGWLAVTEGPAKGLMHEILPGEIRIGRGENNDLVISDALVSRAHAMLVCSAEAMKLSDLASSGGTLVNGESLAPSELSLSSIVTLGDTELMFVDVESAELEDSPEVSGSSDATIVGAPADMASGAVLIARKGPDAGQSFRLDEGDNVIGRGEGSISLTDPSISRRHAVIRRSGDKFIIYDLGSQSGTEVDGKAVGGAEVSSGDVITLGTTKIVVMGPGAG